MADEFINAGLNIEARVTGEEQLTQLTDRLQSIQGPLNTLKGVTEGLSIPSAVVTNVKEIASEAHNASQNATSISTAFGHVTTAISSSNAQAMILEQRLNSILTRLSQVNTGMMRAGGGGDPFGGLQGPEIDAARRIMAGDKISRAESLAQTDMINPVDRRGQMTRQQRMLEEAQLWHQLNIGLQQHGIGDDIRNPLMEGLRGMVGTGNLTPHLAEISNLFGQMQQEHLRQAMAKTIFAGAMPEGQMDRPFTYANLMDFKQRVGLTNALPYMQASIHGAVDTGLRFDSLTRSATGGMQDIRRMVALENKASTTGLFDTGGTTLNKILGYEANALTGGGILLRRQPTYGDATDYFYNPMATRGYSADHYLGQSSDDRDSFIARNQAEAARYEQITGKPLWTDAELSAVGRGDMTAAEHNAMVQHRVAMANIEHADTLGKKPFSLISNAAVLDNGEGQSAAHMAVHETNDWFRQNGVDFREMTAQQRKDYFKGLPVDGFDGGQQQALLERFGTERWDRAKAEAAARNVDLPDSAKDDYLAYVTGTKSRGVLTDKMENVRAMMGLSDTERWGTRAVTDLVGHLNFGEMQQKLWADSMQQGMMVGPDYMHNLTGTGVFDDLRAQRSAILRQAQDGTTALAERIPANHAVADDANMPHGPPHPGSADERIRSVFGDTFQSNLDSIANPELAHKVADMAIKAATVDPSLIQRLQAAGGINVGAASQFADPEKYTLGYYHPDQGVLLNPDLAAAQGSEKYNDFMQNLQRAVHMGVVTPTQSDMFDSYLGHEFGHALAPQLDTEKVSASEQRANALALALNANEYERATEIVQAQQKQIVNAAKVAQEASVPRMTHDQKLATAAFDPVATGDADIDQAMRDLATTGLTDLDTEGLKSYKAFTKPGQTLNKLYQTFKKEQQEEEKIRKKISENDRDLQSLQEKMEREQEEARQLETMLTSDNVSEEDKQYASNRLQSIKNRATSLETQAANIARENEQFYADLEHNLERQEQAARQYIATENRVGELIQSETEQEWHAANAAEVAAAAKDIDTKRTTAGTEGTASSAAAKQAAQNARELAQATDHLRASMKTMGAAVEQAVSPLTKLRERFEQVRQAVISVATRMATAFRTAAGFVHQAGQSIIQVLSRIEDVALRVGHAFFGLGRSAQGGMGMASRAAQGLAAAGYSLQNVGQQMTGFGQQARMYVTQGMQQYMDFETQLAKTATFAGISAKDAEEMVFAVQRGQYSRDAQGNAQPLDQFNASQIAEALYHLSSAGVSIDGGNKAAAGELISSILRAAGVSGVDPEQMIKTVLNTTQMFGGDIDSASGLQMADQVTKLITFMAGISALEIPDIQQTLKMVGPMANILAGGNAGQGLSDIALMTVLASMGGLRGSQVGRGLSQIYSSLIDPSKEAMAKWAAGTGYTGQDKESYFRDSFFKDDGTLKGGLMGFLDTIMQQTDSEQEFVQRLTELLPTNASRTAIAMGKGMYDLKEQGKYDEYKKTFSSGDIEGANRLMEDATLNTMNTLASAFARIKNAWFEVQTRIIDSIKGDLINAFHLLADVLWKIGDFIKNNEWVGKLVAGFGLLASVGATVLGTFLSFSGTMLLLQAGLVRTGGAAGLVVQALGGLLTTVAVTIPLLLLLGAAAVLIGEAWQAHGDDIIAKVKEIQGNFQQYFASTVRFVATWAMNISKAMAEVIKFFVTGVPDLENFFALMIKIFGPDIAAKISATVLILGAKLRGLREAVRDTVDWIVDHFGSLKKMRLTLSDLFNVEDGEAITTFDKIGQALRGFGEGLFAGIAGAVSGVIKGIEAFIGVVTRMLNWLGYFGKEADGVANNFEKMGQVIGAVLGVMLVGRLMTAIPFVDKLATGLIKLSFGMAKLAVQAAFTAVRIALLTVAFIAQGVAALFAAGPFGVLLAVLGLVAIAALAYTAKTQGLTAALTGAKDMALGFWVVVKQVGEWLLVAAAAVWKLIQPILSLIASITGAKSNFEALGMVLASLAIGTLISKVVSLDGVLKNLSGTLKNVGSFMKIAFGSPQAAAISAAVLIAAGGALYTDTMGKISKGYRTPGSQASQATVLNFLEDYLLPGEDGFDWNRWKQSDKTVANFGALYAPPSQAEIDLLTEQRKLAETHNQGVSSLQIPTIGKPVDLDKARSEGIDTSSKGSVLDYFMLNNMMDLEEQLAAQAVAKIQGVDVKVIYNDMSLEEYQKVISQAQTATPQPLPVVPGSQEDYVNQLMQLNVLPENWTELAALNPKFMEWDKTQLAADGTHILNTPTTPGASFDWNDPQNYQYVESIVSEQARKANLSNEEYLRALIEQHPDDFQLDPLTNTYVAKDKWQDVLNEREKLDKETPGWKKENGQWVEDKQATDEAKQGSVRSRLNNWMDKALDWLGLDGLADAIQITTNGIKVNQDWLDSTFSGKLPKVIDDYVNAQEKAAKAQEEYGTEFERFQAAVDAGEFEDSIQGIEQWARAQGYTKDEVREVVEAYKALHGELDTAGKAAQDFAQEIQNATEALAQHTFTLGDMIRAYFPTTGGQGPNIYSVVGSYKDQINQSLPQDTGTPTNASELLVDMAGYGNLDLSSMSGKNIWDELAKNPGVQKFFGDRGLDFNSWIQNSGIAQYTSTEEGSSMAEGEFLAAISGQSGAFGEGVSFADKFGADQLAKIDDGLQTDWNLFYQMVASQPAGANYSLVDFYMQQWDMTREQVYARLRQEGIDPAAVEAINQSVFPQTANTMGGQLKVFDASLMEFITDHANETNKMILNVTQEQLDSLSADAKLQLAALGYSFALADDPAAKVEASWKTLATIIGENLDELRKNLGGFGAWWEQNKLNFGVDNWEEGLHAYLENLGIASDQVSAIMQTINDLQAQYSNLKLESVALNGDLTFTYVDSQKRGHRVVLHPDGSTTDTVTSAGPDQGTVTTTDATVDTSADTTATGGTGDYAAVNPWGDGPVAFNPQDGSPTTWIPEGTVLVPEPDANGAEQTRVMDVQGGGTTEFVLVRTPDGTLGWVARELLEQGTPTEPLTPVSFGASTQGSGSQGTGGDNGQTVSDTTTQPPQYTQTDIAAMTGQRVDSVVTAANVQFVMQPNEVLAAMGMPVTPTVTPPVPAYNYDYYGQASNLAAATGQAQGTHATIGADPLLAALNTLTDAINALASALSSIFGATPPANGQTGATGQTGQTGTTGAQTVATMNWDDWKAKADVINSWINDIGQYPATVLAVLDATQWEADASVVNSWINGLQNTPAHAVVVADTAAAMTALDAVILKLQSMSGVTVTANVTVTGVPGMYTGGVASGGMTLVGEQGPEIVHLPTGSRVYNYDDTKKLLGSVGMADAIDRRGINTSLNSAYPWLPGFVDGGEVGATPANTFTVSPATELWQDPSTNGWITTVPDGQQVYLIGGAVTGQDGYNYYPVSYYIPGYGNEYSFGYVRGEYVKTNSGTAPTDKEVENAATVVPDAVQTALANDADYQNSGLGRADLTGSGRPELGTNPDGTTAPVQGDDYLHRRDQDARDRQGENASTGVVIGGGNGVAWYTESANGTMVWAGEGTGVPDGWTVTYTGNYKYGTAADGKTYLFAEVIRSDMSNPNATDSGLGWIPVGDGTESWVTNAPTGADLVQEAAVADEPETKAKKLYELRDDTDKDDLKELWQIKPEERVSTHYYPKKVTQGLDRVRSAGQMIAQEIQDATPDFPYIVDSKIVQEWEDKLEDRNNDHVQEVWRYVWDRANATEEHPSLQQATQAKMSWTQQETVPSLFPGYIDDYLHEVMPWGENVGGLLSKHVGKDVERDSSINAQPHGMRYLGLAVEGYLDTLGQISRFGPSLMTAVRLSQERTENRANGFEKWLVEDINMPLSNGSSWIAKYDEFLWKVIKHYDDLADYDSQYAGYSGNVESEFDINQTLLNDVILSKNKLPFSATYDWVIKNKETGANSHSNQELYAVEKATGDETRVSMVYDDYPIPYDGSFLDGSGKDPYRDNNVTKYEVVDPGNSFAAEVPRELYTSVASIGQVIDQHVFKRANKVSNRSVGNGVSGVQGWLWDGVDSVQWANDNGDYVVQPNRAVNFGPPSYWATWQQVVDQGRPGLTAVGPETTEQWGDTLANMQGQELDQASITKVVTDAAAKYLWERTKKFAEVTSTELYGKQLQRFYDSNVTQLPIWSPWSAKEKLQMATGGIVGDWPVEVGEKGPELVQMPYQNMAVLLRQAQEYARRHKQRYRFYRAGDDDTPHVHEDDHAGDWMATLGVDPSELHFLGEGLPSGSRDAYFLDTRTGQKIYPPKRGEGSSNELRVGGWDEYYTGDRSKIRSTYNHGQYGDGSESDESWDGGHHHHDDDDTDSSADHTHDGENDKSLLALGSQVEHAPPFLDEGWYEWMIAHYPERFNSWKMSKVGAHAVGGLVSGYEQLSIVGEQGPELVHLPSGSRVYTHADTKAMLAQSGIDLGGTRSDFSLNRMYPGLPAFAAGGISDGGGGGGSAPTTPTPTPTPTKPTENGTPVPVPVPATDESVAAMIESISSYQVSSMDGSFVVPHWISAILSSGLIKTIGQANSGIAWTYFFNDVLLPMAAGAGVALAPIYLLSAIFTAADKALLQQMIGTPKDEHNYKVQMAATGGVRTGMTIVGEQGPELVHLPSGSRVYTHADTKKMLAESGLDLGGTRSDYSLNRMYPGLPAYAEGGRVDDGGARYDRDLPETYPTETVAWYYRISPGNLQYAGPGSGVGDWQVLRLLGGVDYDTIGDVLFEFLSAERMDDNLRPSWVEKYGWVPRGPWYGPITEVDSEDLDPNVSASLDNAMADDTGPLNPGPQGGSATDPTTGRQPGTGINPGNQGGSATDPTTGRQPGTGINPGNDGGAYGDPTTGKQPGTGINPGNDGGDYGDPTSNNRPGTGINPGTDGDAVIPPYDNPEMTNGRDQNKPQEKDPYQPDAGLRNASQVWPTPYPNVAYNIDYPYGKPQWGDLTSHMGAVKNMPLPSPVSLDFGTYNDIAMPAALQDYITQMVTEYSLAEGGYQLDGWNPFMERWQQALSDRDLKWLDIFRLDSDLAVFEADPYVKNYGGPIPTGGVVSEALMEHPIFAQFDWGDNYPGGGFGVVSTILSEQPLASTSSVHKGPSFPLDYDLNTFDRRLGDSIEEAYLQIFLEKEIILDRLLTNYKAGMLADGTGPTDAEAALRRGSMSDLFATYVGDPYKGARSFSQVWAQEVLNQAINGMANGVAVNGAIGMVVDEGVIDYVMQITRETFEGGQRYKAKWASGFIEELFTAAKAEEQPAANEEEQKAKDDKATPTPTPSATPKEEEQPPTPVITTWDIPKPADTFLPAFATGGITPQGMALVGEEGPELVHFPSGSRVYSATDTEAMLTQMMANMTSSPLIDPLVIPSEINGQPATVDQSAHVSSPITVNFHGDMQIRSDEDISKLVDKIDRELGRRNQNAARGMVPTARTTTQY